MLGQGLNVLGADKLVVVWGPDVYDVSAVCRRARDGGFGKKSSDNGRDPEQKKDYTYRRASEWAFLGSRPGRRVYSAIHKKSQWSQNKESRIYAATSEHREHEQAQKEKGNCWARRPEANHREKSMLPETYPESFQRRPALGVRRLSSCPAKQAGRVHGHASRR